ncbi:hypothetical protein BDN72DRAFT_896181 [Pluteus cervinus]|uniref:Uncharacterized protein n=1 Tax=Pluteus cervinus TaxID=181527 RepID=A0ACD3AZD1_9AGAR|nr:hypothetical protein BDN72DRAFT_896181 [Pluteus cervinus]
MKNASGASNSENGFGQIPSSLEFFFPFESYLSHSSFRRFRSNSLTTSTHNTSTASTHNSFATVAQNGTLNINTSASVVLNPSVQNTPQNVPVGSVEFDDLMMVMSLTKMATATPTRPNGIRMESTAESAKPMASGTIYSLRRDVLCVVLLHVLAMTFPSIRFSKIDVSRRLDWYSTS